MVSPTSSSTASNGLVKGVVFDFDGTLVDSYPLIEQAFAEVMRAHRLEETARELFRRSRGLPLPEQMKRISPELWEDLVRHGKRPNRGRKERRRPYSHYALKRPWE